MDMKFLQPATKEEAGGIEKNNMDIYMKLFIAE